MAVHAHRHTWAQGHTLTGLGFPAHVVVVVGWVMVNWRTNGWASVRSSQARAMWYVDAGGERGGCRENASPLSAASSSSSSSSAYSVSEEDRVRIDLAIRREIMTPHLSVGWSDFECAVPFKVCLCECVCVWRRMSMHMANHVNGLASRRTFVFTPGYICSPQFWFLYEMLILFTIAWMIRKYGVQVT